MSLLGGDLRAEFGLDPDILAIMLPGVLTRANKTLVSGRWVDAPNTVDVLGFMDTRQTAVVMGGGSTVIATPERIAVLLGLDANGDVIPEPKPQDRLLLQGETHGIRTVERDPAGATWTCILTEVGA